MPLHRRDENAWQPGAREDEKRRKNVTAIEQSVPANPDREELARARLWDNRFARLDALPRREFGDDDMYDEGGLPR